VLTEIKNRGVEDVCIPVFDGLKGLPEAINTIWDREVVQTCIVQSTWVRRERTPPSAFLGCSGS
jgi:transposase-like protein